MPDLTLFGPVYRKEWRRHSYLEDRQYLFLDGVETPYFIDTKHPPSGWRATLHGTGMHPSGCAATLGFFHTIREAKAEAERRAEEWLKVRGG